jgi:undecaprenyl-phosphate 4-deoxy-4-formamido-L-arabinose transferase
MKTQIDYSIVVPVYNAENSIHELINQINLYFQGNYSYEIILVDDYSIDNSWKILKQLKKDSQNITIIKMAKNFGQHGATLCGMKYAKGTFVITIDDDLEIEPKEISKLIEKQKQSEAQLVYGVFKKKNNSLLRSFLSSIYKLVSKLEGKNKGKGSSFRLLHKNLYSQLVNNHRHFVFIDELCLWYTNEIGFTPVVFNNNHSDKKRYKTSILIRITSNLILFSSSFPLKLVTYIGLLMTLINFGFGSYFIVKKLFFRIDTPGFSAIIVSVLFSSGLIILSIGIIAQYIRHMLRKLNNVPSYNELEIDSYVND